MHEPSRRRVLAAGVGFAGLLAGCGAPTTEDPTPTATPTPTLPADAPAYWQWLPTPDALGLETFSFGSLDLDTLADEELRQGNLRPRLYTPESVEAVYRDTTELLTLSTVDVGAGILLGDYERDAVVGVLEDDGFEEGPEGRYSAANLTVVIVEDGLVWADAESGAETALEALLDRRAGTGESYVLATPPLESVLDALTGYPARFAREVSAEDDGPFATARFLGTAIGASEDAVTWRTAIAFEGSVPDAAREHYQTQFETKEGFENVVTSTRDGLLVMDADTSVAVATATRPL